MGRGAGDGIQALACACKLITEEPRILSAHEGLGYSLLSFLLYVTFVIYARETYCDCVFFACNLPACVCACECV